MDLRESLADLSGLVMGAGQRGLEDMLTHVADVRGAGDPGRGRGRA